MLLGINVALADATAGHTVTVIVEPINEVALEGGDLELVIDSATAGERPDEANGTARLLWTTNDRDKKITVATDRNSSAFSLRMEALNVSGGESAGIVSLSTTPRDLVVGISTTVGSADLSYVASATAEAATGSEVHTVSFTITSAH